VVHATVYRSVSQGLRQVSGAVIGVVLASAVGHTFGLGGFAIALVVTAGLAAGATPWFAAEGPTIAGTAILVLTTGFSNGASLASRLEDTATGIAVGLLVTVVVWPPLRRTAAVSAIDEIDAMVGHLLVDVADDISSPEHEVQPDTWVDRTRAIDARLDGAWTLVRQSRESARLNLRRAAAPLKAPGEWNVLLGRMEQAVADTRSMARTIDHSVIDVNEWEPLFRRRWTDLLRAAGEAVAAVDGRGLAEVRVALGDLARDLSDEDLPARHWPEYGALIINVRNIVTSMDRVAALDQLAPIPPDPLIAGP
jgi:hypothetical protein